MPRVKSGINLIWKGANANIPAGYSRNTDMDDKFPKGTANATDPNDTGGSSTHSHNATSNHSHSENAHSHDVTIQTAGSGGESTGTGTDGAKYNHIHTAQNHSFSGGGLSSVSATYDSVSNNPPYYEVIFIESDGSKKVPDGVVALSEIDAPTGFTKDADLNGKFLKGASNGADGGGTGGSTTNVHTLSHNHVINNHYHTWSTTQASETCDVEVESPNNQMANTHTHSITASNENSSGVDTPNITTTETVEPAYTKMIAVRNNSGDEQEPYVGMVGLWFGTLDNIPSGWVLCDGQNETTDMRGRHLKATNVAGDLGNTGGSNTHSHSNDSHSHTATATHSHTLSGLGHSGGRDDTSSTSTQPTLESETHGYTVSNETATFGSATTSSDSSNNEPAYRTTAFIKLDTVFTPKAGYYI